MVLSLFWGGVVRAYFSWVSCHMVPSEPSVVWSSGARSYEDWEPWPSSGAAQTRTVHFCLPTHPDPRVFMLAGRVASGCSRG